MSAKLTDRLITAGKTYAKQRKEIRDNTHLTEQGREDGLAKVRKAFDEQKTAILHKFKEGAKKPAAKKAAVKDDKGAGLAEFKDELQDSEDPGRRVLDLIMKGQHVREIQSPEGQRALERALEKAGTDRHEIEREMTGLLAAAKARAKQLSLAVPDPEREAAAEGDTEARFWSLVLPTLADDIPQQADRGGVVIVPVLDGEPIEVKLDGTE